MEEPLILTSRSECTTRDEPPHAGKKLGKSTVEERHADSNIWNGNVPRMHIVKREDKGRRRKSEQASTVIHDVDEFQGKVKTTATYRGTGFATWHWRCGMG